MSVVGFIGLGTMGRPMARNLMAAGHELVFFARRAEVAAEFAAAGARQVDSPAMVTELAEVIFTIVTADAELAEVTVGAGGVVEGAGPGKTLIDMSTVGPNTARQIGGRLGDAGMAMLDAPVSGGPWGAESGKLTIMAGGEVVDFERNLPLLKVLGEKVFHVGPLGAGQTVKLINQMLAAGTMALIGEGLTLAKAAGVDLQQVIDVIGVSSGASAMLEARGKKFVLANQYEPGFTMQLMRKDVGLATELGHRLDVPLPLTAAALQQYTAALNLGHATEDFAAIAKVCEQAAGVKLAE